MEIAILSELFTFKFLWGVGERGLLIKKMNNTTTRQLENKSFPSHINQGVEQTRFTSTTIRENKN